MPTLASELRNRLQRVIIDARDAAEAGARAALQALAVHESEAYPHFKKQPELLHLRNALRARARQLGDRQDSSGRLSIDHLVDECAYEHWHRMLFARFLAENGLLIEPQDNIAISLAEAEELAKEDDAGVWVFASRCAQRMLPQIFRSDDPLLQVSFATEHMLKLEKLLASLPQAVFTASDALGWVYQFWQSKKKDEVNRSEVKIGADEIAAVTQLFTEPYMVQFLLHNTLGAWWAGKKLTDEDTVSTATEEELRRKLALPGVDWEYLRFVRCADGTVGPWGPAAGTFDGWPKAAAQLKVLDPCCGSGHFLVAGLHHLVPIRMAEEGLSAAQAVDAVLRDNLHGLEIDERCCQIAAFALALAAWTYPDAVGYRLLPDLHIACTGIGPQSTQEQWLKLADESGIPMPTVGREAIKNGLLNLHRLFSQAPTLGSLINPAELRGDLIAADYKTIQPYLAAIMSAEKADDETRERAVAAAGMVKAAELLAGNYTLVITNVPYLGRNAHTEVLEAFADNHYGHARADLATIFIARCVKWLGQQSTLAVVSPQNWLFLKRYLRFRTDMLSDVRWRLCARLGDGAFDAIGGAVVQAALLIFSHEAFNNTSTFEGIDAGDQAGASAKAAALRSLEPSSLVQQQQHRNPDARVVFAELSRHKLLSEFADAYQGIGTSDNAQFLLQSWEISPVSQEYRYVQTAPTSNALVSGGNFVLCWENGEGRYYLHAMALKEEGRLGGWKSGGAAWGCRGFAVSVTGRLQVSQYLGDMFDTTVGVVIPKDESHLAAIDTFLRSDNYETAVRRVDQALSITEHTLLKVPFDLAYWQDIAAKKYPHGLPEPESDDPTQWLFHGRPEESSALLQVAVARLLGYRWPAELDGGMRLSKRARALVERCAELTKFAAGDGIVCIPSVRGEEPAADRLAALLAAVGVKPASARNLASGADLEDWLRNGFFDEHCKLFHDRPFVWHIWDGRKRDGFHALLNYHKLCEGKGKGRKLLDSLTYSYLGEWITRQKDGVKRGEGGAEERLAAALELQKRLEAILEGKPPFDLFVRWKPFACQPIGWEPDINDGVRINIRPFLASDLPSGRTGAGVLRSRPNVKWTKDRGREPERPKAEYPWFWGWDEKTEDFLGSKTFDGNRWNDCHYTNKVKQAARDSVKKAKR